jgi:hypothetical protein
MPEEATRLGKDAGKKETNAARYDEFEMTSDHYSHAAPGLARQGSAVDVPDQ